MELRRTVAEWVQHKVNVRKWNHNFSWPNSFSAWSAKGLFVLFRCLKVEKPVLINVEINPIAVRKSQVSILRGQNLMSATQCQVQKGVPPFKQKNFAPGVTGVTLRVTGPCMWTHRSNRASLYHNRWWTPSPHHLVKKHQKLDFAHGKCCLKLVGKFSAAVKPHCCVRQACVFANFGKTVLENLRKAIGMIVTKFLPQLSKPRDSALGHHERAKAFSVCCLKVYGMHVAVLPASRWTRVWINASLLFRSSAGSRESCRRRFLVNLRLWSKLLFLVFEHTWSELQSHNIQVPWHRDFVRQKSRWTGCLRPASGNASSFVVKKRSVVFRLVPFFEFCVFSVFFEELICVAGCVKFVVYNGRSTWRENLLFYFIYLFTYLFICLLFCCLFVFM